MLVLKLIRQHFDERDLIKLQEFAKEGITNCTFAFESGRLSTSLNLAPAVKLGIELK